MSLPKNTSLPVPSPARESASSVLAKNLVIARTTSGMTQQELAAAADIARATIAQLEAGIGDPRLSTIAALAKAVRVAPSILLGDAELADALSHCCGQISLSVSVAPSDRAQMRDLIESGLLKDRLRAARIAAAAAHRAGLDERGIVEAAIFSAFEPEHGVAIAALLRGSVNRPAEPA